MKWKIITDSGCDLREMDPIAPNTEYVNVPLTIQVGERAFVDSKDLDINQMMTEMYAYEGKTSSSCPSPEAYVSSFEGADNVLVVTITGTLSGSYNSAELAKKIYLEQHPNANVHVYNTLSASGEMILLAQKLNQLIEKGLGFDQVVKKGQDYLNSTRLLFVLANVDNLVKNGRLNKLIGRVVGLLNIRMVGRASDEGTLELLQKPRGQKKAVAALFNEMLKAGYQGGRVFISHCNNPEICAQITVAVHEKFPGADIQSIPTSGLCSYYAEQAGILMGYEVQA